MELDFTAARVRCFVAVAEEGRISLAAARLDVPQPAVLVQAIAELEAELGLELLERQADGVTLTPAGHVFLARARAAVAAYDEAALAGQRLGRVARGQLQVGFVGPPPLVLAPELFAAFADRHSDAELSFHDLQFPRGSTASWLGGADVGLCFSPSAHPRVHLQTVREDPRVVIAPRADPLSRKHEVTVAEVIDETFVGFDRAVERGWAGLLTLDDHRAGPPARLTGERAGNALEMLTIVASGQGIVALAASHGEIIRGALPNLAVIPLRDAHPTRLTLAWRSDIEHPLVEALVAVAEDLGPSDAGGARP
ncbi:MAG TPA: LysR substrate-binding domain-containing protein [Solirubrobacteraceae bacterium]|nr:LysR substrate-binding domain-containing protein [Solirubrobacteraceae bacterium]